MGAYKRRLWISEREAPPDILTQGLYPVSKRTDIMPTCSTIAKELRQSLAGTKEVDKNINRWCKASEMSLFWEECICNAKGHKYPGHEEYVKAQELAKESETT